MGFERNLAAGIPHVLADVLRHASRAGEKVHDFMLCKVNIDAGSKDLEGRSTDFRCAFATEPIVSSAPKEAKSRAFCKNPLQ